MAGAEAIFGGLLVQQRVALINQAANNISKRGPFQSRQKPWPKDGPKYRRQWVTATEMGIENAVRTRR